MVFAKDLTSQLLAGIKFQAGKLFEEQIVLRHPAKLKMTVKGHRNKHWSIDWETTSEAYMRNTGFTVDSSANEPESFV